MRGATEFMQSMHRANTAIRELGARGFVVIGMKCGNYHPVIKIETPENQHLLKAHVVAVREGVEKACSHVQTVPFKGCLVEWDAPEELVNKYYKSYKSPEFAGFELAEEDGQSHD